MILRFRRVSGGNVVSEDEETQAHVTSMKVGEVLHGKFTKQRNIGFHRKFFAMLGHAYEHWDDGIDGVTNPELFREEVLKMAGHCEAYIGMNGVTQYKTKSISFANCGQKEFEKVYSAVVDVVLMHVLTSYTKDDLDEVVAGLLRFT